MTPSNDQYDTTVEKIDTAETLANTGLDMLPLFAAGLGLLLLALAIWFVMRSMAE